MMQQKYNNEQSKEANDSHKNSEPVSFRDTKKTLSKETNQDIENFQKQFPQISDDTIYRIMKKNEFKKSIIETELNYYSSLQREQKQDVKEKKPKKQKEKTDIPNPDNQKNKKQQQKVSENQQSNPDYKNNQFSSQGKSKYPKSYYQDKNDDREYDNNYHKQNNFKNQKYQKIKGDFKYEKGQQNQKYQKQWGNSYQNSSVEYVAKPESEQNQNNQNQQAKETTDKELSNINEESEEPSQIRVNLAESPRKHKHKESEENLAVALDSQKLLGDLMNHKHQNEEDTKSRKSESKKKPNRGKYYENDLYCNGINKLIIFSHNQKAKALANSWELIRHIPERQTRPFDKTMANERKNGFPESKKKKPAIKNNFETEENEESNTERVKKMNHFTGHKKFESEEEKMKGDRERLLEGKINENSLQINLLNQKIRTMEYEIETLKGINEDLIETNKKFTGRGSDNFYCIVPYDYVKNTYPFDVIKLDDLKESNVYVIKK